MGYYIDLKNMSIDKYREILKSAGELVNVFHKGGHLKESTGYKRNRSFVFGKYLILF